MIQLCITYGKEMRDGPKHDGLFLGNSINLHHAYISEKYQRTKILKGYFNELRNEKFILSTEQIFSDLQVLAQIINNNKKV